MTGSAIVLLVLSSHTVIKESEKATVAEEATEPSLNMSAHLCHAVSRYRVSKTH